MGLSRKIAGGIAFAAFAASGGCSTSSGLRTVTPAPEWNAVFERNEGWIGGDGAATVALGDDVVWLFGDSGVGRVESGKYAPGSTLVNNAVALQHATSTPPPPDAVRFAWGSPAPDGKQTALFVPPRAGEWYWPTGGGWEFYEGGPNLVLFMSRLFRPRERDDGVWNFEGRGSDLVVISKPSRDPGQWRSRTVPTPGAVGPDFKPPARRITWGTSVCMGGSSCSGRVFIYGVDTTEPLNKRVLLASVSRAEEIAEPAEWLFWNGERGDPWTPRLEDAVPIADHAMDEFSVSSLPPPGGGLPPPGGDTNWYVLIHSQEFLGRQILARTARSPAGPWSEAKVLYECPEPLTDKRLMAYSAKAHPELSSEGELLVSYCVNSTDFWHMLSDASIYRPRFIRVPLSALPEPPAP